MIRQEYNIPGLGPEFKIPIKGMPGFVMRIEDNLRDCVIFLGFEDNSPGSGGIHCVGTAFLLAYKNAGYLITAKHVAKVFEDNPFLIRINRVDGTSQNIPADEVIWHYHPDDNVDVAVVPFEVLNPINNLIYKVWYFSENMLLTDEIRKKVYVGIGDECYTIGLFKFLHGKNRNLPVVHTGNIALIPEDEKIPVVDWDDPKEKKTKYIDAYLVESQSIAGLSGSPVLVRLSIDIGLPGDKLNMNQIRARIPSFQLSLIGLWQGAWKAPPSEVWGFGQQGKVVVPVGMGVVIPAFRIIEVLELPILAEKRRLRPPVHIEYAASPDVAKPIIPDNPQHKEDFNSLVTAATKKKPQDDKT